ncbi:mismatch-specific DNA-glycosylase [Bradyrhizobium manausense]|nr:MULTISPECIES: mismatch-specific DNA-glycosylase [Bradyrhizobium]MBR0825971.1 mismatch-specific DNA-glycosylase [Bradyrhizobium manausense]UVO33173.1 mismatch-specific DNA-glycosylase [Bradyrhizobium arachidis]
MPETTFNGFPDQLRENLCLLFVGTAASTHSAALGHYYAHPGNRFWRALHEAGITLRRYQPGEFTALLALGIGFTDLSKPGTGMDHEIARQSFDVAGFRAKIERYRPKTIAFTSKKAASLFYGGPSGLISLRWQQAGRRGSRRLRALGTTSSRWQPRQWFFDDLACRLTSASRESLFQLFGQSVQVRE